MATMATTSSTPRGDDEHGHVDKMASINLKEPTTFLSLPAELRNEIYELAECFDVPSCHSCGALLTQKSRESGTHHYGMPHEFDKSSFSAAMLRVNGNAQYTADLTRQSTQTYKHPRQQPIPDELSYKACHCDFEVRGLAKIALPAITHVSKQVREETLPMFYGRHTFVLSYIDQHDFDGIKHWLQRIGSTSAAQLRDVVMVHPKKKDAHYIQRNLQPEMTKLGLRVGDGGLRLKRSRYPHCDCAVCVMSAATHEEGQDRNC